MLEKKKSSLKLKVIFLISVNPELHLTDSEDEEIDDDEESALAVTNVSQIKFFASLLFQFFSRQISSIVFLWMKHQLWMKRNLSYLTYHLFGKE